MLETAWESRWLPDSNGGLAQLGEHLPCKQGVESSNLLVSIQVLLPETYLENRIPKIKDIKTSEAAIEEMTEEETKQRNRQDKAKKKEEGEI